METQSRQAYDKPKYTPAVPLVVLVWKVCGENILEEIPPPAEMYLSPIPGSYNSKY